MNGAGLLIMSQRTADDPAPAAYLNYILFDQNYVPYDFGFDRIDADALERGTGTPAPHDHLHLQANITRAGYAYVYLSNESATITEVYFDDLRVQHQASPVVQTAAYYPFGLVAAQAQKEGAAPQRYQYNGKELLGEEGLNWHDYGARMYDAALGRWHVIDPMAEKYAPVSPYAYALNSPIVFTDPDGKDVEYVWRVDPYSYSSKGWNELPQDVLKKTEVGREIMARIENNKNIKVRITYMSQIQLNYERGDSNAAGDTWVDAKGINYKIRVAVDRGNIWAAKTLAHEVEAHINIPILWGYDRRDDPHGRLDHALYYRLGTSDRVAQQLGLPSSANGYDSFVIDQVEEAIENRKKAIEKYPLIPVLQAIGNFTVLIANGIESTLERMILQLRLQIEMPWAGDYINLK
jgi:RHS repeat-associated protein